MGIEHNNDEKLSLILLSTMYVIYAMVFMTKQCFNAAMADIVNEGFLTKTQTGFIIMVFYLIYAPMQVVGGIAADKYDSKKLIIIGLMGSAVANAGIFFNNSYYIMTALWGFNAFVQFALWPSILKILVSKLHIKHRRIAFAYITITVPIGAITAYLTAAFIKRWQYNFAVSAIVLFVLTILFYSVYSHVNKHMSSEASKGNKDTVMRREEKKMLKTSVLIFCSGLIFVLLIAFMKEMVLSGIKGLSPVMLMETYEYVTPKTGNLLNIIILLSGVFGAVISGIVNTHYRRREFEVLLITWILTVPAWITLVFIGRVGIQLCVLSLAWIHGLVTAGTSTMNCWVIQFQKFNCAGIVAGMINSAASVGITAESYLFCVIADKSGWNNVIYICMLLCLICEFMTICGAFFWKRFNIKAICQS